MLCLQMLFSIDCKNSIIRSESPEQIVVGLGLKNIIAVAMSDAVLVADKSQTQKIKNVVETLRQKIYHNLKIYLKIIDLGGGLKA